MEDNNEKKNIISNKKTEETKPSHEEQLQKYSKKNKVKNA